MAINLSKYHWHDPNHRLFPVVNVVLVFKYFICLLLGSVFASAITWWHEQIWLLKRTPMNDNWEQKRKTYPDMAIIHLKQIKLISVYGFFCYLLYFSLALFFSPFSLILGIIFCCILGFCCILRFGFKFLYQIQQSVFGIQFLFNNTSRVFRKREPLTK